MAQQSTTKSSFYGERHELIECPFFIPYKYVIPLNLRNVCERVNARGMRSRMCIAWKYTSEMLRLYATCTLM